MRLLALALVAISGSLVACGSDSTGPDEPRYPDVAGTYTFVGAFDDAFCFDDEITGTLTIVQPDRDSPSLSGTANVSTVLCDGVQPLDQLSSLSVSESGQVGFRLMRPGGTSVWEFTGSIQGAGNSIVGTWGIVAGTVTGTWSAHRQ